MEDSHLFLFKQTFPEWSTVILLNQLMHPLTSKELDIVGFCSVWPWEHYVRWLLPTCWNGAGNRVAEVPGEEEFLSSQNHRCSKSYIRFKLNCAEINGLLSKKKITELPDEETWNKWANYMPTYFCAKHDRSKLLSVRFL